MAVGVVVADNGGVLLAATAMEMNPGAKTRRHLRSGLLQTGLSDPRRGLQLSERGRTKKGLAGARRQ
jgi:hypothetical protein